MDALRAPKEKWVGRLNFVILGRSRERSDAAQTLG